MLEAKKTDYMSYMIRQLPSPTIFIDKNFGIVMASDAWKNTFYPKYNALGDTNIFTLFPELDKTWKKTIKECFKGFSKKIGTQQIDNKVYYEWNASPWYSENESTLGAIIQFKDVSKQVISEKEVHLLKEQARLANVGRWEYDLVTNELYWSNNTRNLHKVPKDYKPDMEKAISFYKEGHHRNDISMALFEASNNGTPWDLNLKIVTHQGKERWVKCTGKAIFENHKIVRLLGTIQDINETVEANINSIKNEKLLRTLIDNVPLNIYIKDIELKKILANKAEYKFLGFNKESEILEKTDFDLFSKETAEISRAEDLDVLSTLTPIIGKETININKEGKETIFHTSKIPFLDENGIAKGIIGISLDISNLREKENELRNVINIASIQNNKLLNFAHIVSHNLRSHSANFAMLLDFLKTEKDEAEKKRIIEMLTDASDNLLETLENLNDVVAINTKKNLVKNEINLNKKVDKVQKSLFGFLINNKAQIINKIPNDFVVKSVPSYLESFLIHFLTNAIKYKHPNRDPIITLKAKTSGKYKTLTIEDNGLGIDLEKYKNKLFGMYKTFHDHEDSQGIGLFNSKNQIEAMKGKITVSSKIDKGTTFKIWFNDKD